MVRETLERIAADEHRHAELAWKYVDWVLSQGGEAMATVLLAEIESAMIDASAPYTVREGEGRLLTHGAVGERLRRRIRRQPLTRSSRPARGSWLAPIAVRARHAAARDGLAQLAFFSLLISTRLPSGSRT